MRLVICLAFPAVDTTGEKQRILCLHVYRCYRYMSGLSLSSCNQLYAIELGEEMAPQPGTDAYNGLIAGYITLRAMLHDIWPTRPVSAETRSTNDETAALCTCAGTLALISSLLFPLLSSLWRHLASAGPCQPLVMGPCVGMSDEPPAAAPFWHAFVNDTVITHVTDVVVMHRYVNQLVIIHPNIFLWDAHNALINTANQPAFCLNVSVCDLSKSAVLELDTYQWSSIGPSSFLHSPQPNDAALPSPLHSYNNDGGDNWKRPGFLAQTLEQAEAMYSALGTASSR